MKAQEETVQRIAEWLAHSYDEEEGYDQHPPEGEARPRSRVIRRSRPPPRPPDKAIGENLPVLPGRNSKRQGTEAPNIPQSTIPVVEDSSTWKRRGGKKHAFDGKDSFRYRYMLTESTAYNDLDILLVHKLWALREGCSADNEGGGCEGLLNVSAFAKSCGLDRRSVQRRLEHLRGLNVLSAVYDSELASALGRPIYTLQRLPRDIEGGEWVYITGEDIRELGSISNAAIATYLHKQWESVRTSTGRYKDFSTFEGKTFYMCSASHLVKGAKLARNTRTAQRVLKELVGGGWFEARNSRWHDSTGGEDPGYVQAPLARASGTPKAYRPTQKLLDLFRKKHDVIG